MRDNHLLTHMNEGLIEAGCDEAGRGPLAGPVYAAAVILPDDFHHPMLNDSKQMTEKAREILRPIIEREAEAFAVEAVGAGEIDSINILNASIAGMWRSIMRLSTRPEYIIVDGNRFRPYNMIPVYGEGQSFLSTYLSEGYGSIPYTTVVKGDARFASIAAASVLAKTYRDEHMRMLAASYPEYGWDRNMGYPTKEHIEAIRRYGYTEHHRKSFHVKELEPVLF